MAKRFFIILLSHLVSVELYSTNLFDNQNTIPVAGEVFVLSSTYDGENIYLSWEIKDGYYMYLKSIELKNNNELISYDIFDSKIELHEDEFFGETQILKKKFNIKADLNYILNLSDVFIYYQGCSESGFCYPLQKNKLF